MRALRSSALGLALACALLSCGCNLFQPRTPEPPSQGGIVIDYSDPASTLQTLARAIESKSPGSTLSAYLGGLADSVTSKDSQGFLAFFDPQAVAVWQASTGKTPPAVWSTELETQVFNDLPNLSGSPYTFTWLTDEQHPNDEEPAPNVKLLHRQYQLVANPVGGGTFEKLAIGYADLTFIKSSSGDRWVISRWQDRVDPTVGPNPSGGQLSFSALRLKRVP